jgi:TolA-binding protein
MKEYASIELLLFQNKKKEALTQFSRMLENYPNHSLTDEIYWKMANINLEQGNFEMALTQLNEITSKYPTDILGDDAMFLTARILEENLRNIDSAQELYNEFLLKYPGSVFTAEARKRFRKLRGDEVF